MNEKKEVKINSENEITFDGARKMFLDASKNLANALEILCSLKDVISAYYDYSNGGSVSLGKCCDQISDAFLTVSEFPMAMLGGNDEIDYQIRINNTIIEKEIEK